MDIMVNEEAREVEEGDLSGHPATKGDPTTTNADGEPELLLNKRLCRC